MAAEHLTPAELAGAARDELPPAELLRASDHLLGCSKCRERVRQIATTSGRPLAETEVTYELLADYLDDQLDPLSRARLEAGLHESPRGAADLENLRKFRQETNALAVDLTSKGSAENNVVAFPRSFARWMLPLAALFLISIAGFWWHARSTKDGALVSSSTLERLSPGLRAEVLAVERSGKLPVSEVVVSLEGKRERLAGGPDAPPSFTLVRPVATAVIETRPRFGWTARADATGYRVFVVDLGSGEIAARGENDGAATTWQPPMSLTPGRSYEWQVEALRGDDVLERVPRPPEPEAKFTVLSAQAQREFEQAEAASKGSHLVVAVAAARAGLMERADQELRALAQENPNSPQARELLENAEREAAIRDR